MTIKPGSLFNYFFCSVIRLFPQKARFKATFKISQKLQPLIKKTSTFNGLSNVNRIDGPDEIALNMLLETLTTHGIKFDLDVTVTGVENLTIAVNRRNGVVFVTAHGLSRLAATYLTKNNYLPQFISIEPVILIPGTCKRVNGIVPCNSYLFKVRNSLRDGKLIGAMLDLHPIQNRTIEMTTVLGPVSIATPLFKIALHTGASIIYSKHYIKNGKVHYVMAMPTINDQHNEFTLAQEFATFLSNKS